MLNSVYCLCSGRLQKRSENAPGQKGKVNKVRTHKTHYSEGYHMALFCYYTDKHFLDGLIHSNSNFFSAAKQQEKGSAPVKAAV